MSKKSVMTDRFLCLRRLTCLVRVLMSDKVDMSGGGNISGEIEHVWGWFCHW